MVHHVDPAGIHVLAARVQLDRAFLRDHADARELSVPNSDVGENPGIPCSVQHASTADHDVVRCSLRAERRCGKRHDRGGQNPRRKTQPHHVPHANLTSTFSLGVSARSTFAGSRAHTPQVRERPTTSNASYTYGSPSLPRGEGPSET